MYEKKNPNRLWYVIIGVVVGTLVLLGILALLVNSMKKDMEEASTRTTETVTTGAAGETSTEAASGKDTTSTEAASGKDTTSTEAAGGKDGVSTETAGGKDGVSTETAGGKDGVSTETAGGTVAAASDPGADPAGEKTLRFRNRKYKDQHYTKHGEEMGFTDADAYEAAAAAVVNDPSSLHKIEKEDGDDVYYREADNAFVVVSTDGYIRTFFYPNGGKKYFDRQ